MRSEFMIDRNGKAFCLYAGLLDEAHRQGLKEIRTTLIQVPSDENSHTAICHCEVTTEKGTFTGLGDASPQNVARAMITCLIRMAETRAKARALRDAVNVGVVALEELDSAGDHDEVPLSYSRPISSAHPATVSDGGAPARGLSAVPPTPPVETSNAGRTTPVCGENSTRSADMSENTTTSDAMTPAQRRMLESLARQAGERVAMDQLSRRDASRMITELKSRLARAA